MTMAKRMTFFRMILPKPLRDLMRLLEILTKYINGGIRTTKKKGYSHSLLYVQWTVLNPYIHFLAELGTNGHVSLTLRQTKSLCLVCHGCTFLRLSPLPAPDLPQQKNRKPSFQANTSDRDWLKLTRKESHQCYIIPFEEFTIIRYSKKTARFCRR